jgi:DNA polymerase/3'-5' exonuclease PolX
MISSSGWENMINMLKDEARKAKEDHNRQFKIILEGQIRILNNSNSSHHRDGQKIKRFPLTGTTEEVSGDLQRIKEKMHDVDHIVFNFNNSSLEGEEEEDGIMEEEIDIEETIKVAKHLSKSIR